MMDLHFLGTGNAQARRARQNTSLLLGSGKKYILVDCSGTPSHSLAQADISVDQVEDVVLTHAHIDHIYALPSLIHNLWLGSFSNGSNAQIRIHANEETLSVANKLIDAFGLRQKPSPARIEFRAIYKDSEMLDIEFDDWSLEVFHVSHAGVPTVGLCMTKGTKRVVFSADSVVCDSVASRMVGADVLIHDCAGLKSIPGHAGAQDINAMIKASNCATIYLTHLPEMTPRELQEVVGVVQSGFRGTVVIPKDGLVITI